MNIHETEDRYITCVLDGMGASDTVSLVTVNDRDETNDYKETLVLWTPSNRHPPVRSA